MKSERYSRPPALFPPCQPGLDAKEDGGQGFREVLELQRLGLVSFQLVTETQKGLGTHTYRNIVQIY